MNAKACGWYILNIIGQKKGINGKKIDMVYFGICVFTKENLFLGA